MVNIIRVLLKNYVNKLLKPTKLPPYKTSLYRGSISFNTIFNLLLQSLSIIFIHIQPKEYYYKKYSCCDMFCFIYISKAISLSSDSVNSRILLLISVIMSGNHSMGGGKIIDIINGITYTTK